MSDSNRSVWSGVRLDRSVAWIAIVAAIALLGLRMLAAQVLLVVIPVAAAGGSLLYLATRSGHASAVEWRSLAERPALTIPTLPASITGFLPAVAALALTGFVLSTHLAGVRTDLSTLLVAAAGTVVLVQILFTDRIAPGVILVEILAVALVVRLVTLAVTPGYIGVDIWTHATVYIAGIAESGSLAPLAESKYLLAPVYHGLGAVGALAVDSPRAGIYLTVGLVVPLSLVFVYGTATHLVATRWALLATALVAFADQFVRWGLHLIPTSLGLVGVLAVLYALTRVIDDGPAPWAVGLALVAALAVVFVHQVSTAVVLVILAVAAGVVTLTWATGQSDGKTALALLGVFLVTSATTLVAWAQAPFGGETFLWRELAVLESVLIDQAGFLALASTQEAVLGGATSGETTIAALVPYVEQFGFALLLAGAVTGGLALLEGDRPTDLALTHLSIGGALFVIVFGLSLFGVRALLPGRWLAPLYAALAVLAVIGVGAIARSRSRRVVLAALVVLAVGYPASMAVAEKATMENPTFEDTHKRFAYTHAEIAAVDSISAAHPPGDRAIATDHPYASLFRRYGGYETDARIVGLGAGGPDADWVVYRTEQSTGPVTFDRSATAPLDTLPPNVEGTVCPPSYNTGYANDEVRLCTASGGDR
ncbi:hypothetical protein [Halococcoides cellulosivorans]|uniref:Glycosyltransferase RgtA/B/C/D-like domain-containing protein n=1 Tax=Halococcoides cellulosivorans TaxID=1679096 RepID=A0A2R4X3I9_9EURY|nr:hypothetical protein [Halococcoides cellulosivorans]AWB28357.1 hypothetical protein HARCEL1_11885 [Halococcoides cellulosivorans]